MPTRAHPYGATVPKLAPDREATWMSNEARNLRDQSDAFNLAAGHIEKETDLQAELELDDADLEELAHKAMLYRLPPPTTPPMAPAAAAADEEAAHDYSLLSHAAADDDSWSSDWPGDEPAWLTDIKMKMKEAEDEATEEEAEQAEGQCLCVPGQGGHAWKSKGELESSHLRQTPSVPTHPPWRSRSQSHSSAHRALDQAEEPPAGKKRGGKHVRLAHMMATRFYEQQVDTFHGTGMSNGTST